MACTPKHWNAIEAGVMTRLGLANALGAGASFLTGTLLAPNAGGWTRDFVIFIVYFAIMFPIGGVLGHRQVHVVHAVMDGDSPIDAATRRALFRVPFYEATMSLIPWFGAAMLFGALNLFIYHNSGDDAARVAITIALGGLTTAGIAYLWTESAMRPAFERLLADGAPLGVEGMGIRMRLLVGWALGSTIPLLIIAFAFLRRGSINENRLRIGVWTLVAVGVLAGAAIIIATARAVSEPLANMRRALARVQQDDLDVYVPVDDAGEVGLLEAGFNEMVAGLRDRRALEDLFGRHVGEDVAKLARAHGVRLGGERREASIVFVDLVGSTRLAQSRPAEEVVTLLNKFFGTVVERIEQEGGWVNKFEGDGAMCVFGAPAEQPDHATRALRAARTLRRDLLALALEHPELVAGIGVSSGDVAAGNVGAAQRYEYTLIGDPVNEAARLTEAAKTRPGGVLAGEEAVARAADGERQRWIVADELALRGREHATLAYEPRGDANVTVPR